MNAQGTEDWLRERAGHATASRFCDVLAKIKAGEAATRRNYRTRLVTERLIGAALPTFQNAAMQWGTETEPEARIAYEQEHGRFVLEVGFIKHPEVEWCGASPDGLVGDDGGIEIKCPYEPTIHIATFESGMPAEHMPQIQGAMWVTGRQWWDFVSYDPRMPGKLKLFVQRVERDDAYIATLEKEVRQFLRQVEDRYQQLLELAGEAA